MKKVIHYVLLCALLFSIIPLPAAHAAPGTPNYFFPNDTALTNTANLDISTPANLSRNGKAAVPAAPPVPAVPAVPPVKISNIAKLPITGTFQQLTASSLNLKVEQITSINSQPWSPVPGRTSLSTVVATDNQFQATADLFPGYNRLTFSGLQGTASTQDVFYVLYDAAPLINKLQISSNNQIYDLNEGADLVVATAGAYIQGVSENATTISIQPQGSTAPPSQQVKVLGNGFFYAATTLKPGLNVLDITLSNDTESITVTRKVYYYDPVNPYTDVQLKVGGEGPKSIFDPNKKPTFTDPATSGELTFTFLAPNAFTAAGATVTVNTYPLALNTSATKETVISNTYGSAAYKLITLKTNPGVYNLQMNGAAALEDQTVSVKISYAPPAPALPITALGTFSYNVASGRNIVKNVSLLPGYDGTAPITSTTPMVALDGAQVQDSNFFVLVETTTPADQLADGQLVVSLEPIPSNVPPGFAAKTIAPIPVFDVSVNKQVFQIQNMPEGAQTIAFAITPPPTPAIPAPRPDPVSKRAKVTYISKLYIEIDNLYEGQIFDNKLLTGSMPFSGRLIGFGNRVYSQQLIINNKVQAGFVTNATTGEITPLTLAIGGSSAPLHTGENTIKIIVKYADTAPAPGVLRTYVKEVKFYIVDSDTPIFKDIRPLTPPVNSPRNSVSGGNPAKYLPASPELKLNNGIYTTTLSKYDLFIEGTGANNITVSEGSRPVFASALDSASLGAQTQLSPGDFNSTPPSGVSFTFKIRLKDLGLKPFGQHVYTIVLSNNNGAKVTQTVTIDSQDLPYHILSPIANTGNEIIVNKNFVMFDVEAVGATDVQINGKSAKPRGKDFPDRYTYTLTGLKPDADNKVALVVKRPGGDAKETVNVRYVSNASAGTMVMEPFGSKHSVFNKAVELTFPKGNALRRIEDGKIQPQVDILFGIASPDNGNTELVNDYNQIVGQDIDYRTPMTSTLTQTIIPLDNTLKVQFTSSSLGREHFTRVSDYYWMSAGMGEFGKVGDSDYKPATGGLTPYSISSEETYLNYEPKRKLAPTDRGTLTLKFNASVVDQAASEVTVFYLNDEGDWLNIGGKVDPKNNTVTVPFDNFGFYMVGKLKYAYDDITNHDWARDMLQALLAKGYMPAVHSDSFGVADYVTRGEFASLLVRATGMKLNSEGPQTFDDISKNAKAAAWTYAEIETAARAGIVQGMDNRIFGPDFELTRQDAAVMIARAMNVKLAPNDDKLKASVEKAFSDGDKVYTYARSSVDAINSAGIMVGTPVISPLPTKGKQPLNFNPIANMTRAEAAKVTVKLLQKYLKNSLPANLS